MEILGTERHLIFREHYPRVIKEHQSGLKKPREVKFDVRNELPGKSHGHNSTIQVLPGSHFPDF